MPSKQTSKSHKSVTSKKFGKKLSKDQRKAEKDAKRKARKGDGSFPDILVVTSEKDPKNGHLVFHGHAEKLETLYTDGQVAAVYKLRRVSTIVVNRKVAR